MVIRKLVEVLVRLGFGVIAKKGKKEVLRKKKENKIIKITKMWKKSSIYLLLSTTSNYLLAGDCRKRLCWFFGKICVIKTSLSKREELRAELKSFDKSPARHEIIFVFFTYRREIIIAHFKRNFGAIRGLSECYVTVNEKEFYKVLNIWIVSNKLHKR